MDGIATKCDFPKYHCEGCLGISKVMKISLPNYPFESIFQNIIWNDDLGISKVMKISLPNLNDKDFRS